MLMAFYNYMHMMLLFVTYHVRCVNACVSTSLQYHFWNNARHSQRLHRSTPSSNSLDTTCLEIKHYSHSLVTYPLLGRWVSNFTQ